MRFQLVSNFFQVSEGRMNSAHTDIYFLEVSLSIFWKFAWLRIERSAFFFSVYLVELQLSIRLVEEVLYCSCIHPMVSPLMSLKINDTSVRASKHNNIMNWKLDDKCGSKAFLFCNSEGNCSLKKSRQNSFRQSSYVFKRQYISRTSIISPEIPLQGLSKVLL